MHVDPNHPTHFLFPIDSDRLNERDSRRDTALGITFGRIDLVLNLRPVHERGHKGAYFKEIPLIFAKIQKISIPFPFFRARRSLC